MTEQVLNDKVVVITGAANGVGRGAALEFAREGAAVVLAARHEERLDELARACERAGGRALVVPTDVGRRTAVRRLAQQAVVTFGRIDVWVNNAGVAALGRFADVPIAEHLQVVETDLLGVMYGSYYAFRRFHQQGSGNLINIASELGKHPAPYSASYAAAKAGVIALGDALRQELRQNGVEGIHVCTVLLPSLDAAFVDQAVATWGHDVSLPVAPPNARDVVDAIVRLAMTPQDEVVIGRTARPGVARDPAEAVQSADRRSGHAEPRQAEPRQAEPRQAEPQPAGRPAN